MRLLIISTVFFVFVDFSVVSAQEFPAKIGDTWNENYIANHEIIMHGGFSGDDFNKPYNLMYITKYNSDWYLWLILVDPKTKIGVIKDLKFVRNQGKNIAILHSMCQMDQRDDDRIIALVNLNDGISSGWYTNIVSAWKVDLEEHKIESIEVERVRCEQFGL